MGEKAKRQRRLKRYEISLFGLLEALDDMGDTNLEEEEPNVDPTLKYFMSRAALQQCLARDLKRGNPRVVC